MCATCEILYVKSYKHESNLMMVSDFKHLNSSSFSFTVTIADKLENQSITTHLIHSDYYIKKLVHNLKNYI